MTTMQSPWSRRLGWCAFFLVGAAVVTSGFEVPANTSSRAATREVLVAAESSPAQSGFVAPSVRAETPPPREMPAPRPAAIHEMNLRQLEGRIRELEARLAERQAAQLKSDATRVTPAPGAEPFGSHEHVPANDSATSARDEEIARETEERATKLVSDIRDQLQQLEGERARQIEEMLDAAK